jgi:hypothetical protein
MRAAAINSKHTVVGNLKRTYVSCPGMCPWR